MTAATHRNQEIGLEIRITLEITLEIKKSHYKSTEIRLEINRSQIRNQVRNHVISKSRTLHVAVSDPSKLAHRIVCFEMGLYIVPKSCFFIKRDQEQMLAYHWCRAIHGMHRISQDVECLFPEGLPCSNELLHAF
jgi:hypothetical protein